MSTQPIKSQTEIGQYGGQTVIPTSSFTYAELADIYNETRVDYIVPMPMNARRMEEYVRRYDVDLDGSFVSLNADDEPTGVGMLGLRADRAWITRLGVIPHRRGCKTGQFLMEMMLAEARERGARLTQLEVIKGNEPAHRLFCKLNFVETRELIVIRRPPSPPVSLPAFDHALITPMTDEEIPALLAGYQSDASWVEEPQSVLQCGSLKGFHLELAPDQRGWVIFHHQAFQIEHILMSDPANPQPEIMQALLYHLHKQFPKRDTKVENIPVDSPLWPVYQSLGYFESFRRVEMFLHF